MILVADKGAKQPIDNLVATMFPGGLDADLPECEKGLVRTLMFERPHIPWDEERMLALGEYAIAGGSPTCYLKVLGYHEDVHEDPYYSWWRGDWTRKSEADPEIWSEANLDDVRLEHVLFDGAGKWAVVVSYEDYGHLIADPPTAQEILSLWGTSPGIELARFEAAVLSPDFGWELTGPKVLAHARAGKWMD